MTEFAAASDSGFITPFVITPGEPAGVGPDLILQMVAEGFQAPMVVMANQAMLQQRAAGLGLTVNFIDYSQLSAPIAFSALPARSMIVYDVPLPEASIPGQLNPNNAAYVLACLDQAIDACLRGEFSALVTGPLHKGVINDAGVPFTGHTEHLQRRCQVNKVVMMLASPRMRVALATTHLALKDVPQALTRESLSEVIAILVKDLQTKFAISKPKILVAGLNPHAGEDGHMGREEIDILRPVMASFADSEVELIGPLPADTLFNPHYLQTADAVLAMYHDQGLPVLKFDGFGESVNITLGLPMIRTSVDHGTALDLAGKGLADSGSFKTAIRLAEQMVRASTA